MLVKVVKKYFIKVKLHEDDNRREERAASAASDTRGITKR